MFRNMLVGFALMLSLLMPSYALVEHKDGSVTLSQKELAQLQDNVRAIANQAYKAGVEDGAEAVKSNPKLCPKDI